MRSFFTFVWLAALSARWNVLDTTAFPTPAEDPELNSVVSGNRPRTLLGHHLPSERSLPLKRRREHYQDTGGDTISIYNDDFWHHHEVERIALLERDEITVNSPPRASRRDHRDDLDDRMEISDELPIEFWPHDGRPEDHRDRDDLDIINNRGLPQGNHHDRIYEDHREVADARLYRDHEPSGSQRRHEEHPVEDYNQDIKSIKAERQSPLQTFTVHSAIVWPWHEDAHSQPLLSIHLLDDKHDDADLIHLHVRATPPNLLDGITKELLDSSSGLLAALSPALAGMPVVGGEMGIVDSTISTLGSQLLANLVPGHPILTSSEFVSSSPSNSLPAGQGDQETVSYTMDASSQNSSSPMILAKLPFSFANFGCNSITNSTSSYNGSSSAGPIPVAIALPVINNASIQLICATYESAPLKSSMLIAQECWNKTSIGPGGTLIPAPQPLNRSQIFAYDESTGIVEPLWNTTAIANTGKSQQCNLASGAGAAPVPPSAAEYTELTAGPATSSSNATPAGGNQVQLVFTPNHMNANASDSNEVGSVVGSGAANSSASTSNSTSSSIASRQAAP